MAKSFLLFHIYFTTRRILFELGGIQSETALPGDPTFSQIKQNYDIPSYRRICAEFGINADSDFRFKRGLNHGLGNVYIYISYQGQTSTDFSYPGAGASSNKFRDEGGIAQEGNLIYFIKMMMRELQIRLIGLCLKIQKD